MIRDFGSFTRRGLLADLEHEFRLGVQKKKISENAGGGQSIFEEVFITNSSKPW